MTKNIIMHEFVKKPLSNNFAVQSIIALCKAGNYGDILETMANDLISCGGPSGALFSGQYNIHYTSLERKRKKVMTNLNWFRDK